MNAISKVGGGLRRVTIMQGETHVSNEDIVLTTILGSCIAACVYDPIAKVGGINHFLLAEPGRENTDAGSMQRYGVYAMEVLINGMISKGAVRNRLRARIYGGASFYDGFRDIGSENAEFALHFLQNEGISLVGKDIGGKNARRIEFRPAHGLARCRTVSNEPQIQRALAPAKAPVAAAIGDVELF